MMTGAILRIITAYPIHHEFAEMVRAGMPQANGAVQRGLKARVVEIIERAAVPRVERLVGTEFKAISLTPRKTWIRVGGACYEAPPTRPKSRLSDAKPLWTKPAYQTKPTHQSMLNPNHHADHCHRPASAASRLSNCASAGGKSCASNSSRRTHFNAAQSSGWGSPAGS
jgi:hypothetical protein